MRSCFVVASLLTVPRESDARSRAMGRCQNRRDGALVGAHLVGPAVTDLIAELALAKTTEVNAESLIHTIHAHPTFAEAVRIATEDALGRAVDL